MPRTRTISDVLRDSIIHSEASFKALETQTGVLRQSLMRFVAGEQSLRLDMADRLADYFGLALNQTVKGKPMTEKTETLFVQGRKIVLKTGALTQTVNICDPANAKGRYEETKEFVEQFAVTKAWVAGYGSLDLLKKDLRRRNDRQIRTLAGI